MKDDIYTARVSREISDLIPTFLSNRRKEVVDLRAHLKLREYKKISALAHRMVGVGTPYGFAHITNLAKVIKEEAEQANGETVRQLVEELDEYLRMVKIEYV